MFFSGGSSRICTQKKKGISCPIYFEGDVRKKNASDKQKDMKIREKKNYVFALTSL